VLDLDIAAFITPEMLQRAAPTGYDLILIPGAITADFTKAERALNTKIRLGPKHAADLGFVLEHLEEVELSRSIPACELFHERSKFEAESMLHRLEEDAVPSLTIKGIKVGGNSRMKVLSEIVDATRLDSDELARKICYYEASGADMIDLGLPVDVGPKAAAAAVKNAKRSTDLPVSIDTVRPDLIFAGVDAGADLVLSLNGRNLPIVGNKVAGAGVPAVLISGPGRLEENIAAAMELGIKAIADPVLDPPLQGLAMSIARYLKFRDDHPEIPLFFGIGNVIELLDADSQGMSALLAALGAEMRADILFTPEYSPKARGSVRELRVASEMMLLAKNRRTPPKDLGIDLLVLKEKRHRPVEPMPESFIEAGADHGYVPDPAGGFRIFVADGMIVAKHKRATVAGIAAKDILNTLIDMGLITRLDHAGYLGRELEAAEVCLRLRRSYSQDEPFPPEKG
jgi:dihydropteroate synthase-like protein